MEDTSFIYKFEIRPASKACMRTSMVCLARHLVINRGALPCQDGASNKMARPSKASSFALQGFSLLQNHPLFDCE